MQGTLVIGHGVQIAPESFDFFELIEHLVITIGPSAYPESFVVACQTDFSLVVLSPPGRHQSMTRHAFLCRRRGREPQVEVAMLCREVTQGPNGHQVGQVELGAVMA